MARRWPKGGRLEHTGGYESGAGGPGLEFLVECGGRGRILLFERERGGAALAGAGEPARGSPSDGYRFGGNHYARGAPGVWVANGGNNVRGRVGVAVRFVSLGGANGGVLRGCRGFAAPILDLHVRSAPGRGVGVVLSGSCPAVFAAVSW